MDIKIALKILDLEGKKVTLESLKKAYRTLSKKYHPDVTGNGDDHLFKLVGESYELLL
jgi:curved DNA-binding protein